MTSRDQILARARQLLVLAERDEERPFMVIVGADPAFALSGGALGVTYTVHGSARDLLSGAAHLYYAATGDDKTPVDVWPPQERP